MPCARIPILAALVLTLAAADPAKAWDPVKIVVRVRIGQKLFPRGSPQKWCDGIMKDTADSIVTTMNAAHRNRFMWLLEATDPNDKAHFPLVDLTLDDQWRLTVALYLNKHQVGGIPIGMLDDMVKEEDIVLGTTPPAANGALRDAIHDRFIRGFVIPTVADPLCGSLKKQVQLARGLLGPNKSIELEAGEGVLLVDHDKFPQLSNWTFRLHYSMGTARVTAKKSFGYKGFREIERDGQRSKVVWIQYLGEPMELAKVTEGDLFLDKPDDFGAVHPTDQ
jgi:hypothetical protein